MRNPSEWQAFDFKKTVSHSLIYSREELSRIMLKVWPKRHSISKVLRWVEAIAQQNQNCYKSLLNQTFWPGRFCQVMKKTKVGCLSNVIFSRILSKGEESVKENSFDVVFSVVEEGNASNKDFYQSSLSGKITSTETVPGLGPKRPQRSFRCP